MFHNIMAKDKVGGQVAYDVIYSRGVAPPPSKQNRNSIMINKILWFLFH